MDPLFDRLGNLLRSVFQDSETGYGQNIKSGDPDLDEAWQELDDFLKHGKNAAAPGVKYSAPNLPPKELKEDYATLNVPFGASFGDVKKSYKKLLSQYHPDKHSGSEEKTKMATEITQNINRSFLRIKGFHRDGSIK